MQNYINQRIVIECWDCGDKLTNFVNFETLKTSEAGNVHLPQLGYRIKPHTCSKDRDDV